MRLHLALSDAIRAEEDIDDRHLRKTVQRLEEFSQPLYLLHL